MRLVTFIFLCFVWGTTWVAIKVSLEGLPPFLGAAARFTIALLILLIYIKWKNISLKMKKKDFWIVSLSAFLMYTLDYGLIYWGEQYLSAGVTAIFFATFPLFTGIFATFLFRNERFQWTKFFGLILALIGVTIVFFDQLIITQFQQKVMGGIIAIITGAACAAMSVVLVKKFLSHFNPVSLSFHQMLQGVLFLLFFGLVFENPQNINLSLRVSFAVVYLGAMGSALAFALYYWLLQQFTATTLSLIIYISPVVALLVDYLVFGEIIQLRAVLGMMAIFAGIALVEFNLKKMIRIHNRILKNL
jgi:drug/metabolite transporter (DMT)-like permease